MALMITTVAVAGISRGKMILVNNPKWPQPSGSTLSSRETGSMDINCLYMYNCIKSGATYMMMGAPRVLYEFRLLMTLKRAISVVKLGASIPIKNRITMVPLKRN